MRTLPAARISSAHARSGFLAYVHMVEEREQAVGQSGPEPGEPQLAESVSQQRRSNEFWLAMASSAVALIIGVVAVVSGWYTASQRDKRESVSQAVDSTRSRQQDAYVGFINSASDVAIAIQLQVKAIENRYPFFLHSPIPPDKADLETKFTDVGHALNVAQLYGDAHVLDQSSKVYAAAAQGRFTVIGWGIAHPAGEPNGASCPELLEFEKKTETDRQDLANAINRFADAARENLGIPALPATSEPPQPLLPDDACANVPR